MKARFGRMLAVAALALLGAAACDDDTGTVDRDAAAGDAQGVVDDSGPPPADAAPQEGGAPDAAVGPGDSGATDLSPQGDVAPPSDAASGACPAVRPGAGNTGPDPGTQLTPMSGLTITTDGKVLQDVAISGTVTIKADNVVLRNFRLDGGGGWYGVKATNGNTGIVIEDGEILNVRSAGVFGGGFTARRLNIHEMGGDGMKATGDVLVECCWIHHLGKNDGAHADANQSRSGSNFVFRHNHCDMPVTDPAPYKSNACFMIQTAEGPITNFLIESNWLNGGNYTIYCAGDVTVQNNRFGRDYRYGIKNGCSAWTGNVWDDTGQPAP